MFRKTNISNYQGVRNVSFSENFAHALNGWPLDQDGIPDKNTK